MRKVCVLIPYYGRWPLFLPIFLKSCSYNSHISFLFFTDLVPPATYPGNVYFHSIPFSGIRNLINNIVGFDTALATPYKLCDVRPAYGLMFKDYIAGYDYWAWGDIDVILGFNDSHIRELLADVTNGYDLISFRKNWVSGSLSLVRNNETMNTLFLTSSDLKKILSSPEYMGFDEISLSWHQVRNRPIEEVRFPHDNFTWLVKNAAKQGLLTAYFGDHIKESISEGDFVMVDNGRVLDGHGTSYLHYHYITEKRRPYFNYPKWSDIPDRFYITTTGFYTEHEFRAKKWIGFFRMMFSVPFMAIDYAKRITRRLSR